MSVSQSLIVLLVCVLGGGCDASKVEADQESPVPLAHEAVLATPGAGSLEISTAELQQILRDQSAVVLDTRPFREWSVSHIPGAFNVAPKPGIPMALYTSDVAEIGRLVQGDKSQALVLYCNGPFCGKSKRVANELLETEYTNVSRYQLGAPGWRTLVGVMEIEADGIRHVFNNDQTAVWIDARDPPAFRVQETYRRAEYFRAKMWERFSQPRMMAGFPWKTTTPALLFLAKIAIKHVKWPTLWLVRRSTT